MDDRITFRAEIESTGETDELQELARRLAALPIRIHIRQCVPADAPSGRRSLPIDEIVGSDLLEKLTGAGETRPDTT